MLGITKTDLSYHIPTTKTTNFPDIRTFPEKL